MNIKKQVLSDVTGSFTARDDLLKLRAARVIISYRKLIKGFARAKLTSAKSVAFESRDFANRRRVENRCGTNRRRDYVTITKYHGSSCTISLTDCITPRTDTGRNSFPI